MFTDNKVTEIFCLADDFYKFFESQTRKYTLEYNSNPSKRDYHRDSTMSMAEVMATIIFFHGLGYAA